MKNFAKKYGLFIFVILFMGLNVVLAKEAAVQVCSQPGTQRAMKLLGLVILILKILVPIILIFIAISEFFKLVISGKQEEFSKTFGVLIRKAIIALLIFFVPTLIHGVFDILVGETTNTDIKACSDCLYDIKMCQIEKN